MTLRDTFSWPALLLSALPMWGTAVAQNALPAAAPADLNSTVRACIDRTAQSEAGLPKFEAHCPDLSAALQAAGVESLIIDSSREQFDRESLRRLVSLTHAANGPMPSMAALAPILRQLHATATPPGSWWRKLWDWVLDHLANGQAGNTSDPWWTGILRLLTRAHWLGAAIIWITIISLPIGVVFIVVREVRAMGKRSTDDPVAADAAVLSRRLESQLALLRLMPLGQRPAQLFAMLIARLVAAGRLPPDRSLTHREVVRKALLDDAEHRRLIESLARLSERQLYAGVAATPVGLEDLLARGEDLYTVGWSRPAVSP